MSFSDDAYKKMIDLYNNHAHECGIRIISLHPGKVATDCITYVINVLSYAFERNDDKLTASKVRTLGKYGTELAAYLVSDHGWKAVYLNPDANHPRDKDYEHVKTYKEVKAKLPYYKIPIAHLVVNYTPTAQADPNFVSFKGKGMSSEPTVEDDSQMAELKKIKFGVGISRGGQHTWLYSTGLVYEVHLDKIGAELYEKTDIELFDWLSGAIIIPPDAYAAAKFDRIGNEEGIFDFLHGLFK
ncbi:hypothetical protein OU994_20070 [Pseudoduganella sp. SL102]|uniref:hypothetical protein n=1 Tax=Pseudoduganella sp. SL102 TaxID=2995154 RepID=UPI00248BC859|nr:hypothetical protein [Pseudoduganella sp. SL102]WBS00605.1 hypothetical protein OU994_20070 [Pseudoduganella sp. SL102]